MTSLNAPSYYTGPKWAAVVSGTVWKRWGVSSAGTLEAETIGGPLIIWAKPAAAKEEGPKLEDPKPTPLEGRVCALNTAAHFARFFWAARGKVRHSIRWKTGRRIRRAYTLEVFDDIKYLLALEQRKLEGKAGLMGRVAIHPHCNKEKGVKKYFVYLSGTSVKIASDYLEMGFDWGTGEEITPEDIYESGCCYKRIGNDLVLSHAYSTSLSEALFDVCNYLRNKRLTIRQFMALLLAGLYRAAYLAHVKRRVKPAPRRARIPRPIHARPRPPSAPLAPPVTC